MARSIAQIQASIVAAKNADATLSGLTSSSATAIWLLWTWVVATAMWAHENLFDAHKAEVQTIIKTQVPHGVAWYETTAKAFQYGYALPADAVVYDTIDAAAQVVNFAAAIETTNKLRIKVASLSGVNLAPLSDAQLTAFTAYMNRVKDAGVRLQCTSAVGDNLRMAMTVYYDPLVIDATGKRLDGTNDTPVLSAIEAFIDGLTFNGKLIVTNVIDAVLAVEGVTTVTLTYCAAQYGAFPYAAIAASYTPDAGYLVLDAAYFNANTTYQPDGVL